MRIRYTPRSLSDLQNIHSYVSERSPLSANRVIGVIERRVAGLTDHPEIGYQSDQLGVRIILAIPYPYRIYYRVRGEEIAIVHVRHTARRLPAPDEL